jgi:hypothetical protein
VIGLSTALDQQTASAAVVASRFYKTLVDAVFRRLQAEFKHENGRPRMYDFADEFAA